MKRFGAVLAAALCAMALAGLVACSSETTSNPANATITGEVTAIDGTQVTLALGEFEEPEAAPSGDAPDGGTEPPEANGSEGDASSDNDGSTAEGAPEGEPPAKPDGDSGDAPSGSAPSGGTQGEPPAMPDGQGGQGQGGQGGAPDGEPPAMPDGQGGQGGQGGAPSGEPPAMPDGESGQGQGGQGGQGGAPGNPPSDAPSGNAPSDNGSSDNGSSDNATTEEPPAKPDGEGDGSQNGSPDGEPPAMPEGFGAEFVKNGETTVLNINGATITSEDPERAENANSEGKDLFVEVGDIITVVTDADGNAETVTIESNDAPGQGFGGSGQVNQGTAANTIDTDGTYENETYTSTGNDENALRVVSADVTLNGIAVNKDAGSSSNTEDGDFYGMNAALLATDGAQVSINGATVTSDAQNGNGIFSYGQGTLVEVADTSITTTADNSGGIQTTGGATTKASNLTIETSGNSSAAIRSDRGGGTVEVDGGTYISNGYNSPAVYSTADITVSNALLTANNSEALVIEGKNSITLNDCDVEGSMSDTKGSSSDINVHNVMIYQSMSGDADEGTSLFTMNGGTLASSNGDLFYITNTHCIMKLSGVEIANHEDDGYLILVAGNNASHGWGKAGANGGQLELTADGQDLEGDIAVDTVSTLNLALTGGSILTGSVNIIENAEGGQAVDNNAVVSIGAGCTWNLTGNCVITSLDNAGTINFNGFTITLADGTVLSE